MIDQDILPFFLEEAEELLLQWEEICLKLGETDTPENHNALFRIAHNLKGSSRSCGLKLFGEVIHEIEDVITRMKNGEVPASSILSYLFTSHSLLSDWITGLKGDCHFEPKKDLITDVRLKSKQLKSGATEGAPLKPEQASVHEVEVAAAPAAKVKAPEAQVVDKSSQKSQESFRVRAEKVEKLIFGIGELTVYKSMLQYAVKSGKISDRSVMECIESLEKTCLELQNNTFSLRMVAVDALMRRLQRVASDVAMATGKEIEFQLTGSELEIDKVVLDTIIDPLTHIIRNSVDHGIEAPEKRVDKGKKRKGLIHLSLEVDSSSLKFIIRDDGAGINPERIFSKACEKGLLDPSVVMSDQEKVNLIFLPSFSTAEQLSDISGRGVGMDVVKTTLDRLGGQVVVTSQVGAGSVFTLTIPTSLNLIDCFITENGENTYLIPISQVNEVISLSDYKPIKQNGLTGVSWRDNIIPLKPLPSTEKPTGSPKAVGIVVSQHGKNFVLTLDRIVGTQQVFLRAPNGATVGSPFIKGNAILSTGKASMVLDLEKVIDYTFQAA